MLRFFSISFLLWLSRAISVWTLRYSCAICLCSSKISHERLHVSSGVRGLRSASKRRQTLPKSSLVVLLPAGHRIARIYYRRIFRRTAVECFSKCAVYSSRYVYIQLSARRVLSPRFISESRNIETYRSPQTHTHTLVFGSVLFPYTLRFERSLRLGVDTI